MNRLVLPNRDRHDGDLGNLDVPTGPPACQVSDMHRRAEVSILLDSPQAVEKVRCPYVAYASQLSDKRLKSYMYATDRVASTVRAG
jgi:hypothetical protein